MFRDRATVSALGRARDLYDRRAWNDAFQALAAIDASQELGVDDLERMAWAAVLSGHEDALLQLFDRLYHIHVASGSPLKAARVAIWSGISLAAKREAGHASAWLARAERLIDEVGDDCVERGYLLVPTVFRLFRAGDPAAGYAAATEAETIGARFSEIDLVAIAGMQRGRAQLEMGKIKEGLATLDGAMLPVSADRCSPLVTGIIYCAVIDACQEVYAFDRGREWTNALSKWCETQPQLESFSGICMVHRAELLQIEGAWTDAMAEAERASNKLSPRIDPQATAAAHYQKAEVLRLRGRLSQSEKAFVESSRVGGDPQPGMALLRLAQGRRDDAASSIRRALSVTSGRLQRARVLPAAVEIMLAVGDVAAAKQAADELTDLARDFDTEVLSAMAAHAGGAVSLSSGDAAAAVEHLRQASSSWLRIGAPYLAARPRVLIALACRALGDEDGAKIELLAARAVFAELGAAPDLARVDALLGEKPKRRGDLTARELEVLGQVAAGKTNKAIAAELSLSEKTVDRHLSNIYNKLGVPSRAAATAYAYEHGLIAASGPAQPTNHG
jgi:DNA-binding NarL/FixJ family response regulator